MDAHKTFSLKLLKENLKKSLPYSPALIPCINRQVIYLKGPAIIKKHGCPKDKSQNLAV